MFRDLPGRHSRHQRDQEDEKIRVTDRRRISLDENDASRVEEVEPNLKPSYVEELEARTRAAELKVQDVQSRFEQLRNQLQTETDATRQRLNKAADERAAQEKANFIAALLPVLDNLARANEAAALGASVDDVAEGVRQTAASFESALQAAGVEVIDAVGEQFDPELHEAVDTIESDEDGTVTAQYARGYRIGNRLLRPARVQVGRKRGKVNIAVEFAD